MESPSRDIADYLESRGIGRKGSTSGWGLFRAEEPSTPDQAITLYDTGGTDPAPSRIFDVPSIQVRVRGSDYQTGYAKCVEIQEALNALVPQEINGTWYFSAFEIGNINWLEYDDNERPIWTLNFRIWRSSS